MVKCFQIIICLSITYWLLLISFEVCLGFFFLFGLVVPLLLNKDKSLRKDEQFLVKKKKKEIHAQKRSYKLPFGSRSKIFEDRWITVVFSPTPPRKAICFSITVPLLDNLLFEAIGALSPEGGKKLHAVGNLLAQSSSLRGCLCLF